MALPYSEPEPAGTERARASRKVRDLATEVARLRPAARTLTNCEEADHGLHPAGKCAEPPPATFPASFTKGLAHDENGLLEHEEDYRCFVEAINSPDRTLFDKQVRSAADRNVAFNCTIPNPCHEPDDPDSDAEVPPNWRGWESPRAGHVYELEGADPGAVGMAPAPRVGSSELAAEMAEVYALALLRDVPFTTIANGGAAKLCPGQKNPDPAILSADEIVAQLNTMPYFGGSGEVTSSTPKQVDVTGLNRFERNRRFGRNQSIDAQLTTQTAFRGSTPGALSGPYVSQFLLVGTKSVAGPGDGVPSYPGVDATFDLPDGFIPYGSVTIDQRTLSHLNCVDYLTDWCSWLDVQNGADVRGIDRFEEARRFITTPRDLATYVHYDALYEAYLNAALILLAIGARTSKGFPEASPTGRRTAFATFGGPHVLTLVPEVATRCLKAVRRQKFNYHRRARPEAIGGRLTLACLAHHHSAIGDKLGCAGPAFLQTLDELPDLLVEAVVKHNGLQNDPAVAGQRATVCPSDPCTPDHVSYSDLEACNLLLPMAFPEGSPMHPSYGAGHATVAGGCVTMIKAFFEMFADCHSFEERPLLDPHGGVIGWHPNADGTELVHDPTVTETSPLTIQGELDKLAANISIGRNMAGVHYYSDYYDSLRMGERIAVSILLEQAPTYVDGTTMTFTSFDGDHITITGEGASCPSLAILGRDGAPVQPHDWWLRHVSGAELIEGV